MSGGAGVRIADALLRGTGGRSVLLRMPSPAIAGDNGEQLGLETPQFQDVELQPVTFRHNSSSLIATELLVSATAVKSIVGSLAYDSAAVLFRNALGVLVGDDLLEIEWVRSSESGGVVYLYQLRLRGALGLLS
jgi:hypothetical protein